MGQFLKNLHSTNWIHDHVMIPYALSGAFSGPLYMCTWVLERRAVCSRHGRRVGRGGFPVTEHRVELREWRGASRSRDAAGTQQWQSWRYKKITASVHSSKIHSIYKSVKSTSNFRRVLVSISICTHQLHCVASTVNHGCLYWWYCLFRKELAWPGNVEIGTVYDIIIITKPIWTHLNPT